MFQISKKQTAMAVAMAALITAGGVQAQQTAAQSTQNVQSSQTRQAMKNSTITRDEAKTRAGEIFDRLDYNKDGKLDQADRDARMAEREKARFDAMDTNKDGQISREEFSQRYARRDNAKREDGQQMNGKRAGNRHWSKGRRHHPAMRGFGPGKGQMEDISRQDFVNRALERFDAMDTNKDGKVTPEERRSAWTAMKQQRSANKAAKAGAKTAPASE